MKHLIKLFVLTIFLIFHACTEESGPLGPDMENPNGKQNMDKYSLINLPPKDHNSLSTETSYSASSIIYKSLGGEVILKTKWDLETRPSSYDSNSVKSNALEIEAELYVPKDAFHDESYKVFSITADDANCAATFEPSPFKFDKPLLLNLRYKNIDLSRLNPDAVKFAYIADDGSVEIAEYDRLVVDVSNGILEVRSAEILHFSRYGFVK